MNLSKIAAAVAAALLCASSVAAQNNLTVADLKAYGDDASTATHALLSDDKITFTDTGGATGILLWDSAGTEFELDNDLKLSAGGFWIGANQIIDSSRVFGNISNSTGSTNVVFSDTPTLATPNWTGTATGVGLTLSGNLSVVDITASGDIDFANDTGTGDYVRATDPALNGTAQTTFTLDSDNAGAGSGTVTLIYNRGTDGSDVGLQWNETSDYFALLLSGAGTLQDLQIGDLTATDATLSGDLGVVNITASGTITGMTNVSGTGNFALVNSPTFVTPTLGAASATSLALSGTLTGATNVSGTGNFALVNSPTFVTPVLGAATGTSLDVTGFVESDDGFKIGANTVIDDARELTVVTGVVTNDLTVGSLSSGGAISGTTGAYTGDLTTTADVGIGDASPAARLHVDAGGTLPTLGGTSYILVQNTSASNSTAGISILGGEGSNGAAFIAFGEKFDENNGQITYDNSADEFRFRTGGAATSMTLDSSGLLSLSGSRITINTTAASRAIIYGTGSPESVVTASVGSMFLRTDGGASTTLYVKESGTGNTGWAAK